ncbi:hypothetical protein BDP55DRAFT_685153 [Colletotrichum godetiae]|uniref:Uncharacterized protein n=1 Tax=Colletotrichum godetiae TaxID=1209918 RepID=A0AAJ0EML1_9PEZI|nr:uncharacterized protein BDP55DRAFT_685153 [Colletotrichum godetiae]KAK1657586.1 hypothetical protein BDP55DRAFT_685153 [Colletotrichum godetiae]
MGDDSVTSGNAHHVPIIVSRKTRGQQLRLFGMPLSNQTCRVGMPQSNGERESTRVWPTGKSLPFGVLEVQVPCSCFRPPPGSGRGYRYFVQTLRPLIPAASLDTSCLCRRGTRET